MYGSLLKNLNEREKNKEQIKVAVAGFGFIGRGAVVQSKYMKGIDVSVVYCRNVEKLYEMHPLARAYSEVCSNSKDVDRVIKNNRTAIVTDPELLYESSTDIVVDTTGDAEFGAELAFNSINSGKHVVCNPETDICVGPYLRQLAEQKNVVYSGQDGDEPGIAMNLYEYVSLLGLDIIATGKFKNYTNFEANPDSVKPWSDAYKQSPYKIASFADGSKMNIEMGLVCNATGFVPDVRGMHCKKGTLNEIVNFMRLKEDGGVLSRAGVTEIVQGVEPSGGVFVIAKTDDEQIKSDMKYFKMGEGPYYLFYRPYHLCSVEILVGAANACINKIPTIAPKFSKPCVDVAAFAKRNLSKGERLDMIGGYCYYGLLDDFNILRSENYLPISLAEGAVLTRDIEKGQMLTLDDVEINTNKTLWKLRSKMLDGGEI